MNLKRDLGWKEATSLGTGAMVGAGILVLSGVAAGKACPAVMLAFVIAAILEILLGLCYAELASRYPRAGGAMKVNNRSIVPSSSSTSCDPRKRCTV
ncbi:amino acid permease [Parageobacillus thermoglucosidasius]|uniref:amino acid permease n=1 Tax=Parageobacillus thermoglucosidasius TaxID=1426 RepID=UPI000B579CAA|nr:amino acid permease [Parageobacillus thermoglucosidasius]MBY6270091.1 amino acid permease [Parageobacillus thermoglucosidasius]OUM93908.1 MAG: amino acid permease [Parageobacillus thermoglucosidasius]